MHQTNPTAAGLSGGWAVCAFVGSENHRDRDCDDIEIYIRILFCLPLGKFQFPIPLLHPNPLPPLQPIFHSCSHHQPDVLSVVVLTWVRVHRNQCSRFHFCFFPSVTRSLHCLIFTRFLVSTFEVSFGHCTNITIILRSSWGNVISSWKLTLSHTVRSFAVLRHKASRTMPSDTIIHHTPHTGTHTLYLCVRCRWTAERGHPKCSSFSLLFTVRFKNTIFPLSTRAPNNSLRIVVGVVGGFSGLLIHILYSRQQQRGVTVAIHCFRWTTSSGSSWHWSLSNHSLS